MKWTGRSDPALVAAIIASFSDSAEDTQRRLKAFKPRHWHASEFWLDTSGLALYFLDRVKIAALEAFVDWQTLKRLEQKHMNNTRRVADQLREFIALNHMFLEAGLCYANLKGFTLYPHSCADLMVRVQSDFDFLIDPIDLSACSTLLKQRGYALTAITSQTWEFKMSRPAPVSVDGQYRVGQPRAIELHFGLDGATCGSVVARNPRLDRLSEWSWEGEKFPTLSPADQFVGQALHLLSHMRNEHTRASWLLEFRRHALARSGDQLFWNEVRDLVSQDSYATIAVGLSIALAADLFGSFHSAELSSCSVDSLPAQVEYWVKQYGRRAVLADVPGTKLYLLLETAVRRCIDVPQGMRQIRRLFPMRLPSWIIPLSPQHTLRQRLARNITQLRYLLYRAHFHARAGISYIVEARRWNRRWSADSIASAGASQQGQWRMRDSLPQSNISSRAGDTK